MFDEELFLELCDKYGVEVFNGKGKNTLTENGIEREITPSLLKEVLAGKPTDIQEIIELTIQCDNDFTQLLLKGIQTFRGECSGDKDFIYQLKADDASYRIGNICRELYIKNCSQSGVKANAKTLRYIEVSIKVKEIDIKEYKDYYNNWNNYEHIIVYVDNGKVCIKDF